MISKEAHAECVKLLDLIICKEMQEKWTLVFMNPVTKEEAPGYFDVIKKPMDLGTVKKNLGSKPSRCRFKTYEKFLKDMRLIFQNALIYNKADEGIQGSVYEAARHVMAVFEEHYAESRKSVFSQLEPTEDDKLAPSPVPSPNSAIEGSQSSDIAENTAEGAAEIMAIHAAQPVANNDDADACKSTSNEDKDGKMSEVDLKNCFEVITKLIEMPVARPFLDPVDLSTYKDYKVKISKRLHLRGIKKKLHRNMYASTASFASDVRQIFSNCLVYNSSASANKEMRSAAISLMKTFEKTFAGIGGSWKGIPNRWECQEILDKLLSHKTNGEDTSLWFKFPLQTYFESPDHVPFGYFDKVKHPMDLGTVSDKLHTEKYKDAQCFVWDTLLIFENCITYWKDSEHGQIYCTYAKNLIEEFRVGLYTHFPEKAEGMISNPRPKSELPPAYIAQQTKISESSTKKKVPTKRKPTKPKFLEKGRCIEILSLLKQHETVLPDGTKFTTAKPFKRPVDVSIYMDYAEIVKNPMDISKIERKLKSDKYESIEDFSADVHLIFSNCLLYNSDPVKCEGIRAMANTMADYFATLLDDLKKKMEGVVEGTKKSTQSSRKQIKQSKLFIEGAERGIPGTTPHPETLNDGIKIASKAPETIKKIKASSKKRKLSEVKKDTSGKKKKKKKKGKVEELQPLDLPEPGASCDAVLRRLLRLPLVQEHHFDHPFIEAFPDINDKYLQVIPKPMDLMKIRDLLATRECTSAEDFVAHGRLVFQNAVTFSNFGSKVEEWSLQLREAAQHLLEHFVICCHEMLPLYGSETEKEVQIRRKLELRDKRHKIVAPMPITLKSRECSKILRTLLSHKYDTICWPFRDSVEKLFPDLPSDYYEVVTTLMDLKTVGDKLSGASDVSYRTYGQFADDVRLTFNNSILYNKAEQGKEGPTFYNFAVEMLSVFDELWADATIDIAERAGREEITRRSKKREMDKRRAAEAEDEKSEQERRVRDYEKKLKEQRINEAAAEEEQALRQVHKSRVNNSEAKLEIKVARARLDRMTKEERKAEDRRRKRERREEDRAKSNYRRQEALAATEDALKECQMRSRRRIDIEKAKCVENQDKLKLSDNKTRELKEKETELMQLDRSNWTGALVSKDRGSFWKRKPPRFTQNELLKQFFSHDKY